MRRMQPYSTRCADTSVVNDLMIHDIDLALALFSDDIEQINAAGTAPMGGKLDHAISSLHGPDDLVITLIASRVSPTRLRSIEVHTTDAWIVADLINRSLTITPLPPMDDRRDSSVALRQMTESPTTILTTPVEPLRLELQHFLNCIHGIERPMVDAVAGFRAMIFANTIEDLALRIARQENVEVVTPRRAAAERIAL
jgi:virulence factor